MVVNHHHLFFLFSFVFFSFSFLNKSSIVHRRPFGERDKKNLLGSETIIDTYGQAIKSYTVSHRPRDMSLLLLLLLCRAEALTLYVSLHQRNG